MESYVAGLEVMALVNQALLPNAHKMGFHTTSVAGVVGAAAAAGKLLHLPQDGLERALSIACTFACGLRANFGTLATRCMWEMPPLLDCVPHNLPLPGFIQERICYPAAS